MRGTNIDTQHAKPHSSSSALYGLVPATDGTYFLETFAPWLLRVRIPKFDRVVLHYNTQKRRGGIFFSFVFSFVRYILHFWEIFANVDSD